MIKKSIHYLAWLEIGIGILAILFSVYLIIDIVLLNGADRHGYVFFSAIYIQALGGLFCLAGLLLNKIKWHSVLTQLLLLIQIGFLVGVFLDY